MFKGFTKICNTTNNTGFLSFDSVDPHRPPMSIPLVSVNNLWYHDNATLQQSTTNSSSPTPTINKLSNAASYKLWHQRLCYPGTNVMSNIHKHALNVPTLKGNSFWKCPSCMSGKFDKSYHIKEKTSKKTQPPVHHSFASLYDDIRLPQGKP